MYVIFDCFTAYGFINFDTFPSPLCCSVHLHFSWIQTFFATVMCCSPMNTFLNNYFNNNVVPSTLGYVGLSTEISWFCSCNLFAIYFSVRLRAPQFILPSTMIILIKMENDMFTNTISYIILLGLK